MSRLIRPVFILILFCLMAGASGCQSVSMERSEPPPGAQLSDIGQEQVERKNDLRQGAAAFFNNLPPDSHFIEADTLRDQLGSNAGSLQIVDIRKPEEYAKGHIRGSINIPMERVGANMNDLEEGKQIVFVCDTGQNAGMTTAALNIANFKAKTLRNGLPAWKEAGYDMVTGGDR